MGAIMHPEAAPDGQATRTSATTRRDAAAAMRLAAERRRRHEDEELDEALLETFPCSDPPSSWAGA